MKILTSLFVYLAMLDCASTQRYETPTGIDSAELVKIYVYRVSTGFHALNPERPYIYLDGKVIAKLRPDQATFVQAPAGVHRLSVRQPMFFMPSYESDSFEYDFQAGETYYIRYSMEFGAVVSNGSSAVATGSSQFTISNQEGYDARR